MSRRRSPVAPAAAVATAASTLAHAGDARRTPASSPLPPWAQWVLIGLFALATVLPMADRWWGFDPTPAPNENRHFAEPATTPTTLDEVFAFPAAYEAWFKDHFGLRSTLIHWHAALMLDGFGVSPTPSVLIGDQGWLYLGKNKAVDAYRCVFPYTEAALDYEAKEVREHRDWLQQRGIAYLHVWAPLKHTVYPEHLPSWVQRSGGPCRLDQWLQRMQREGLPVLDLRPSQRQAKAEGLAYHLTDTHWNPRGAYHGYRAIVEALRTAFPALQPLPPQRVRYREADVLGGDLARLMDLAERYRGPTVFSDIVQPRCREAGLNGLTRPKGIKLEAFACGHGPKIVMLHDSFGNALIPYLAQTAGRLLTAEFANFDKELIEHEKPDVVIEVHLERQLQPDR